ncbi:Uncharacterised protein [Legionella spiritensis]|nr:Uncharacterised protein [Legionella spiritensis]
MLVLDVQEFIASLTKDNLTLSKIDRTLLSELKSLFSAERTEGALISAEEQQTLLHLFKRRWDAIKDGPLDYTFHSSEANKTWILLAEKLAEELEINYLEILIPVIDNKVDPEIFSHLRQLPDPRSLLLGEDDKTWHRVQGIFQLSQKSEKLLAIYDDAKKMQLRALSIKELFRLREKQGEELAFSLNNENYRNIWDFLVKDVAPSLNKSNQCPHQLLVCLMELLDGFQKEKPEALQVCLKNIHHAMMDCSLTEVNGFYGIKLGDEENTFYLFELLTECWQGSENLADKLQLLAQYVAGQNPALISSNEHITSAYEHMRAGPYFTIRELRDLLDQLPVSFDFELQTDVIKLRSLACSTDKISEEIIEKLRDIFACRWRLVIDTPSDYTRLQTGENKSWIALAQHLAGSGYVDKNYYRLLMPTVTHDEEFINGDSLTAYPLSSFIVSEDNQKLIYLPHCHKHYLARGTFYNCNSHPPVPLTVKEAKRLLAVNSDLYKLYIEAEKMPDPAISKSTVEAVRTLVNASLYPIGLYYGKEYNSQQMEQAMDAYTNFMTFVNELADTEYEALYQQRIVYHAQRYSFAEIMTKIQNGKENECVAVYSQYLAKLVIDYDPNAEFKPEITRKCEIDKARIQSARKVYRDCNIEQEEAIRRSLILFISLLTHPFKYLPGTGEQIEEWDNSNRVTRTGKLIFEDLKKILIDGDARNIRFVYSFIIDKIVKSARNENWISTFFSRYSDTDKWLKSIANDSLFNSDEIPCFEPEHLVIVLSELVERNPKYCPVLDDFIEELLQTMAQRENRYRILVRCNVKLIELFRHVGKHNQVEKREILDILNNSKERTTPTELMAKTVAFLQRKLTTRLSFNDKEQRLFHFEWDIDYYKSKSYPYPIRNLLETFQNRCKSMLDSNPGLQRSIHTYLERFDSLVQPREMTCDFRP